MDWTTGVCFSPGVSMDHGGLLTWCVCEWTGPRGSASHLVCVSMGLGECCSFISVDLWTGRASDSLRLVSQLRWAGSLLSNCFLLSMLVLFRGKDR